MKLAKYIKNARLYKGMTQASVAARIGTTTTFVSLIENGSAKIPLDKLKVLIKIYGLDKNEVVNLSVNEYEKMLLKELLWAI